MIWSQVATILRLGTKTSAREDRFTLRSDIGTISGAMTQSSRPTSSGASGGRLVWRPANQVTATQTHVRDSGAPNSSW